MAKTEKDIRALIEDCERPFKAKGGGDGVYALSPRDRMKQAEETWGGYYDYGQHLDDGLAKISVQSITARFFKNLIRAELDSKRLRNHLEAVGRRGDDRNAADRVELMEAHWLHTLQQGGSVDRAMNHFLAVGYFFPAFLMADELPEVEQGEGEDTADYNERVEDKRQSFQHAHLEMMDPEVVAYREHNQKLQDGMARFKLPIDEYMERFYKADRSDIGSLEKLLKGDCGYIDEAVPVDRNKDSWSREITVCVTCDNKYYRYWVEGKGNKLYAAGDFQEKEHYFGRVPLFLAEGIYNPSAPLGYRREGILTSVNGGEWQKNMIKSLWFSQGFTQPMLDVSLPDALAQVTMEERGSKVIPAEGGRPQTLEHFGKAQYLKRDVTAELDKVMTMINQDLNVVSPMGLINTDESKINSPASWGVMQIDQMNAMVGAAVTSRCNFWSDVLDAMTSDYKYRLNKGRKEGDAPQMPRDWLLSRRLTGKEYVKGRKPEQGKLVLTKPQDYDIDFSRELEPIDNRLSTKERQLMFATNLKMQGGLLDDEWLGMVRDDEDISGFKEKWNTQEQFKADQPQIIMSTRAEYASYMAARDAVNEQQIAELEQVYGEFVQTIPVPRDPGMTPEYAGAQVNHTVTSPTPDGITAQGAIS